MAWLRGLVEWISQLVLITLQLLKRSESAKRNIKNSRNETSVVNNCFCFDSNAANDRLRRRQRMPSAAARFSDVCCSRSIEHHGRRRMRSPHLTELCKIPYKTMADVVSFHYDQLFGFTFQFARRTSNAASQRNCKSKVVVE